MLPTVRDILRWRHLLAGGVRLLGVIMLALSLYPLISWITEGLRDFDLLDFSYYMPRIVAVVFLVPAGLAFIFLADLVACFLIPMPKPRCPQCRYRLERLQSPICPECGLALPEEFVTGPSSAAPSPPSAPLD